MAEQLDISFVEHQRCAIELMKPYNSSIKPMETKWDKLRLSSGGGALETEKRTCNVPTFIDP
jgi:hypothetical protein